MPPLPRDLSSRDCIRALERAGFHLVRQKGSHIVMRRDEPYAQVVVPETRKLPPGTLKNIIRGADLTVEEFIGLL
jgi:predicted RNA binding protein YcfA (HicA-like mRNA interferase family)